jgi:DNA helicase HerA-like ATPase
MMDMLFDSLRNGKLCVVDISQMRGQNGLILSGIILQQIFEHNQKEFTEANPNGIPTIAVLEEAQSVLGGSGGSESPYVAWVKEGRKFGLGAVLITQQPGSISDEILSQGDNWFIFHLLSSGDLQSVKKANAHFSNDLLSSLLNEPIPGNGIFWSSSGGKPYPLSIRVLSFEELYKLRDPDYNLPKVTTYASRIKENFDSELRKVIDEIGPMSEIIDTSENS